MMYCIYKDFKEELRHAVDYLCRVNLKDSVEVIIEEDDLHIKISGTNTDKFVRINKLFERETAIPRTLSNDSIRRLREREAFDNAVIHGVMVPLLSSLNISFYENDLQYGLARFHLSPTASAEEIRAVKNNDKEFRFEKGGMIKSKTGAM